VDTVPTTAPEGAHPAWCSPEHCTVLPNQGGTHCSAEQVVIARHKDVVLRLERSEPDGHTVLVIEAWSHDDRHDPEPVGVISVRLAEARTVANQLHHLLALADEADR
jgi:hypothetical protein